MLFAAAAVDGGLLRHVSLLARELRRSGHDVVAALSPAPGADRTARACEESGARVARIEVRGKGDFAGMLSLKRLVSAERPDIFHAHLSSPGEGLPALAAARWGGAARRITTEHAPAHFPLERVWSRGAKRLFASSLHAIIAVCENDARLLRGRFGMPEDRVRVIPNGVDPPGPALPDRQAARAALGADPGSFVIGFAGALEIKKGVLDLVEAARSLSPDGLVLALAGEGSLAERLRSQAAASPFRMAVPGRVEAIGAFMSALDLFVLPSHQEAMPLSLLEAMMAGLPIVATRVGGVPEALREGSGLLVEPGRPADLARAVAGLMADPRTARRLGDEARRLALSRFTSDRMARDVESLYRAVLASGRASVAGAPA